MTFFNKIVAVIGLLVLSMSSYAVPTTEVSTVPAKVTLTVVDVCTLMQRDTIIIADMYKTGKTHAEVASFLVNRFEKNPEMAYALPGLIQIISMIDELKTSSPSLFEPSNFPKAMGIATFGMCMNDQGVGWVQAIPGRAKIHQPKFSTPNPKVRM